MDFFYGSEDVELVGFDGAAAGERVGEDVEHDLGVGGRVQVAHVRVEEAANDVRDVGEIAVVGEDDAVRGVHVEGLGFGDRSTTGGGVTDVSDAGVAEQAGHVDVVEDLGDEAVAFFEVKAILPGGGNTGGVLSAMLEHGQGLVHCLTGWAMAEKPDDTAHVSSLPLWPDGPEKGPRDVWVL
jgi:hypothetical protein